MDRRLLLRGEERRREEEEEGEDSSSWVNLLVIRGLGWQTLELLFAIFARWIVLRFPPRRSQEKIENFSFDRKFSDRVKRTFARTLSPLRASFEL